MTFSIINEEGTGTEKYGKVKEMVKDKKGPVSRRVENHVEHVNRNDILDMCPPAHASYTYHSHLYMQRSTSKMSLFR